MYASKILKIIYAPRKTLKEVTQDPKYIGPILIMILVIAVTVGSVFVVFSKVYDQQFLPSGAKLDEWTQNSTFWTSNALVTESNDSITGTYFGNASIAFAIQDNTQVWMHLAGIGTINCSSPDGYDTLSFRLKWNSTNPDARPENASIQMFSFNSSAGYYNDITNVFSNTSQDIWNNITLPLGSSATGWNSTGQNDSWSNVTGLQLQFNWTESSNITTLVDGLFFLGPYQSRLETTGISYTLSYGAFSGAMQYVVTWVVLSGLIYVAIKAFSAKVVWKPLLMAVGFSLITLFIGGLITAIVYSAWPTIRFPFEIIGDVPGEGTAASNAISDQTSLVYNVATIVQYAIWIWTAALAALVTRTISELSWAKSALVGVLSYFITLLIVSILVG